LIWIGARCFQFFVRGEAYLAGAAGGSEAAAEFQKILDHRGLVLNQPIGGACPSWPRFALMLLQGRHPQGPRAAYQDFPHACGRTRTLDIPVLQQAKAEYGEVEVERIREAFVSKAWGKKSIRIIKVRPLVGHRVDDVVDAYCGCRGRRSGGDSWAC